MKKKNIISLLTICAGVLAVSSVTQAAEVSTKDRTANVEIKAGEGEITPDPPKPYPPTGPYEPVGQLGITSATNLYFPAVTLSSETTTVQASYVNTANNAAVSNEDIAADTAAGFVPGYSVTDRRGTGAGWVLSLQLGEFKEVGVTDGHTIRGAKLKFPSVAPITVDTANPIAGEEPTALEKEFAAGSASSPIMTADEGQGRGLWEARYYPTALTLSDGTTSTIAPIELEVPGDNYVGRYQADLVWSLDDGPLAPAP